MALSLKKEEKPENEKRITFVEGQIFQKMITVQSEKGGGLTETGLCYKHYNKRVCQ